jgi:hypothetical protein
MRSETKIAAVIMVLFALFLFAISSPSPISGAATRAVPTCSGSSCASPGGPADSCSDSDGGRVIEFAGLVYGSLNYQQYTYDDYCAAPKLVMEYHCDGIYWTEDSISCPADSYGMPYCVSSSVYRDVTTSTCRLGACIASVRAEYVQTCPYGCYSGACA